MNILRAIALMVLGMALLAGSDAFIKLASQRAPIGQVMIVLSLGGAGLLFLLAWLRGLPIRLADATHRLILMRNVFEMVGGFGMLIGLSKIPLSVMAAIMQTAPLAVTVGAAVFLKEQVGWRRWSAVGAGLVGMLMVIRPFGADFSGWEIFAVIGVLGLAARDLVTRMAPDHVPSIVLSAWGFTAVLPVGIAMLLFSGVPPVSHPVALWQMLGAVVVTTSGYLAVTTAMRLAPASAVSPFRYSRLIFTAGLGMIVFAERPDFWTYAGSALILGAGLYAFVRERRVARSAGISL